MQHVMAHEGPDPAGRWAFTAEQARGRSLEAVIGPAGQIEGEPRFERFGRFGAMLFDGQTQAVVINEEAARGVLPEEPFTLAAWVSIDEPRRWGGIAGYFQDNGDAETGWVLGYNQEHFTIGLSTRGADDGDGEMTYLTGKTPYQAGRFHHVAATYDGATLSLYVDGKLDASSREQSGPILYPEHAELTLGGYRDRDEDNRLRGRISDVLLFHDAATGRWVAGEFEHGRERATYQLERVQPTLDRDTPLSFMVKPFLQFATTSGITVTWETTRPGGSVLCWGQTAACDQHIELEDGGTPSARGFVHQQRIEGLTANTQYFYRVETAGDNGQSIHSETRTFQTAPQGDTPFAFAVVGDTQGNLEVAGRIAQLAWAQRPSFLLHVGDLVDTGTNKSNWTEVFFPSLEPLISRVPIFPVLGNHEDDAEFYYQYMDLPEPEYCYTFVYGNMQFFMIDTNRNVSPGSEQYRWLQRELEQSQATWKIACHHHPPYSSDENDFGDLWKTNTSSRGDLRARQLCELYDRYKVDIVWNGHIHSYERTWPIRDTEPTDTGGTVYMITGGGGGGLETPGPFRNPFQNTVYRGHHYTMVHVNGRVLEVRAYEQDGRLLDTFTMDKRQARD